MKDLIYRILAKLYPMNLIEKLAYYKYVIQSYRISSRLGSCGKGTRFSKVEYLTGHQHIHVGKNTIFLPHLFLTAWGEYDDSIKISIGDYCSIGAYCHISAYNKVSIGNHVLIGKWVSIVDNDHGETNKESLMIPPLERELVSKGPIVIGNHVWIGDKVTILSGVTIGNNSVIAANSVITKDVPPFSVVAGNPGKVIKVNE